jgi:hypothetical protein
MTKPPEARCARCCLVRDRGVLPARQGVADDVVDAHPPVHVLSLLILRPPNAMHRLKALRMSKASHRERASRRAAREVIPNLGNMR